MAAQTQQYSAEQDGEDEEPLDEKYMVFGSPGKKDSSTETFAAGAAQQQDSYSSDEKTN